MFCLAKEQRENAMTREFLIYDENEVGHTLKMDDTQLCAYIDDKQRKIAPKDYLFLSALADHVNEVVSREELIAQVEGTSSGMDNRTVDVYILHLRKKLAINCIQTVIGRGYRLSGMRHNERG